MKSGEIVAKMMESDFFSQWLGIKILEVDEGRCKLSVVIRKEMLNGFGIAHGGITYSLADSALAFASNSKGRQSLSIETSIAHVKRVNENDTLFAHAVTVTETDKIGHYEVKVWATEKENPVALF